MPTARELLEQADALMRRNRARQVDTGGPELTEVIPMPATPSRDIEAARSLSPAFVPGIQVAPSSSIAATPGDQDVAREGAAKAAPAAADDWARWQALAEEIRMQVLQRIDIFTDTGLREQL